MFIILNSQKKNTFKFPKLRKPKRIYGDNTFIDKYWLLDEMQRIKNELKNSVNKIDDVGLLFEIRDNKLDNFIEKLYDRYYHISPTDKNPVYTTKDFSDDIKQIRKIFEDRIEKLIY